MTRRRHLPNIWLLLAAALLARALLPAGWMPVAHAEGVRIALCTGTGPAFVALTPDGRLDKHPPGKSQRDPCPFGLAGAQAAQVPSAEWPVLPAPDLARTAPSFEAGATTVRRCLRPPARGPPGIA